jgi:hypothetical protein
MLAGLPLGTPPQDPRWPLISTPTDGASYPASAGAEPPRRRDSIAPPRRSLTGAAQQLHLEPKKFPEPQSPTLDLNRTGNFSGAPP